MYLSRDEFTLAAVLGKWLSGAWGVSICHGGRVAGVAYWGTFMRVGCAMIGRGELGFQLATGNIQTIPGDLFDGRSVGSLAGIGGMAAVAGTLAHAAAEGSTPPAGALSAAGGLPGPGLGTVVGRGRGPLGLRYVIATSSCSCGPYPRLLHQVETCNHRILACMVLELGTPSKVSRGSL